MCVCVCVCVNLGIHVKLEHRHRLLQSRGAAEGIWLKGEYVMWCFMIGALEQILLKVKVKQSCYRPGVAQRVPGS